MRGTSAGMEIREYKVGSSHGTAAVAGRWGSVSFLGEPGPSFQKVLPLLLSFWRILFTQACLGSAHISRSLMVSKLEDEMPGNVCAW